MSPSRQTELKQFLEMDLGIPVAAIALAFRQCASSPRFLPMVLWQYGLVTLDQFAQILDWLDMA
jgi:hypothetical protein